MVRLWELDQSLYQLHFQSPASLGMITIMCGHVGAWGAGRLLIVARDGWP